MYLQGRLFIQGTWCEVVLPAAAWEQCRHVIFVTFILGSKDKEYSYKGGKHIYI